MFGAAANNGQMIAEMSSGHQDRRDVPPVGASADRPLRDQEAARGLLSPLLGKLMKTSKALKHASGVINSCSASVAPPSRSAAPRRRAPAAPRRRAAPAPPRRQQPAASRRAAARRSPPPASARRWSPAPAPDAHATAAVNMPRDRFAPLRKLLRDQGHDVRRADRGHRSRAARAARRRIRRARKSATSSTRSSRSRTS